MNSISFVGSPSRNKQVPGVHVTGVNRSQIASTVRSSIWSKSGTRLTNSIQMCCLMSRLMSNGSSSRIASSSTFPCLIHLWRSCFRIRSRIACGNCLWFIHNSVSICWILYSSNLSVLDSRYVSMVPITMARSSNPVRDMSMQKCVSARNVLAWTSSARELKNKHERES